MYGAGLSLQEIDAIIGKCLARHFPMGWNVKHYKQTEPEIELMGRLVEEHGMSVSDLELLFNRSSSHIRRNLRAAGIPPMIGPKRQRGPKPQPVFPPGFRETRRY